MRLAQWPSLAIQPSTRPRQPLHVLYPSNRHLSAKTRLFVDWVAEVFAPFDDR